MKNIQYIPKERFDTIPTTTYKITTRKQDITNEIVFDTSKFILNVPIGSGKSTNVPINEMYQIVFVDNS